jgi:hypothetical protein
MPRSVWEDAITVVKRLAQVKSFAVCQHLFGNGVTSVTEAAEPK